MINIIYVILIFMTLIGSVASLFLKKASVSKNFIELLKNRNIYLGAFLYIFSALLNIYVLKYLDYSIVLPLTSLTYIWTMIISKFLLKEKLTYKKIIGTFLIFCGALIIIL